MASYLFGAKVLTEPMVGNPVEWRMHDSPGINMSINHIEKHIQPVTKCHQTLP